MQLAFVQSLEDAGRTAEADGTLKTVADKFPGDVRVPFQQGALLEKRKDYTGAEAAFRSALLKDPDHAPTLNYLGYMLAERTGRLDEAVSLVQQALKVDPDNGSYLDSLGWALVQQKKYARSRTAAQARRGAAAVELRRSGAPGRRALGRGPAPGRCRSVAARARRRPRRS